jgi:hypothetical protein
MVVGFCENSDELPGYTQGGNCSDWLTNYHLFKQDPIPWNYFTSWLVILILNEVFYIF